MKEMLPKIYIYKIHKFIIYVYKICVIIFS